MIKLTDLLEAEKAFTATSKETGNVAVFKTKAARDAAVKAGSHEKRKTDKDDAVDVPTGEKKPNMFSKDTGYDAGGEEPKSEPNSDTPKTLPFDDDTYDEIEGMGSFDELQDFAQSKKGLSDEQRKQLQDLAYEWEDAEGEMMSTGDDDEYEEATSEITAKAMEVVFGPEDTWKDDKEEPKSEPKDSSGGRVGNPKINKAVSSKAKKLGITPQKLGKEEYESRMSKAAVEALTDSNFHSEARKLISILEDKPEWDSNPMNDPDKPKDVFSKEYDEWRKNTVFSSELYDSAEGTDEIAHLATNQSGWEGQTSVDAIAYDLKMNGSKKLAAKIQSIFEGKVSNGFKNHSLKDYLK